MTKYRDNHVVYHGRRRFVLLMFLLCMVSLFARAVDLQVFKHAFLLAKAERGHFTNLTVPASRGMITDRNNKVLAVSTPVGKVWYHPSSDEHFDNEQRAFIQRVLDIGGSDIALAEESQSRRYLHRAVPYDLLDKISQAKLPGIGIERSYRRYYPQGETFAHVLGFTNVDDQGQEGLEFAFDDFLAGQPGLRRVLRDRRGNVLEQVSQLERKQAGQTLRLSLDERIQYLAYIDIKRAVAEHGAKSGSAVVLDVHTGEVLAMVSQPSFNPNDWNSRLPDAVRNRAVKDVFEPGSSFKPFTLAAALESGQYHEHSIIDTSPGSFKIGSRTIKDPRNYGEINFGTLLSRSSNVGASKVSMSLPKEDLWKMLDRAGFGRITDSGFPHEVRGRLRDYTDWYPDDQANISFGYGVNVTPLQLAQGYSIIAADGLLRPITFLPAIDVAEPTRVMTADTARAVRNMMQEVVSPQSTGFKAAVEGYRVAGKTGTSQKLVNGRYSDQNHYATFAGMAPAEAPRLVVVVVIDDPGHAENFGGGDVAAPVFSSIMRSALRLLNVRPDQSAPSSQYKHGAPEVSL